MSEMWHYEIQPHGKEGVLRWCVGRYHRGPVFYFEDHMVLRRDGLWEAVNGDSYLRELQITPWHARRWWFETEGEAKRTLVEAVLAEE